MTAPSTVAELRSICKSLRPSILFLMETKASKLRCVSIRRKLGFDNMFCMKFRGLFGGYAYFEKKELTYTNNNLDESKAFIGDFNDVITQEEKVRLHPKLTSQIEAFRSLFSNPRNDFFTKERIDRVLANWEWRRAFQHATLSALPAISSDHNL
ncbi:hypothetical protein Ahy_A01g000730 [Arachis hypogaea]|uniref:Uncharacterized protein n=1 Tax=Arachis hypogaea TaxID=3818 RepID=A0A445EL06_ARAHY|nr:hypothetical protein Ahy_A01g000730 [Arachis hypogaea]